MRRTPWIVGFYLGQTVISDARRRTVHRVRGPRPCRYLQRRPRARTPEWKTIAYIVESNNACVPGSPRPCGFKIGLDLFCYWCRQFAVWRREWVWRDPTLIPDDGDQHVRGEEVGPKCIRVTYVLLWIG